MTSLHLKDSTINYRWLLTSRQRTRCDKTDSRRMQASSQWGGAPPTTDPQRRPSGVLHVALIASPWRRSSPRGVPASPGSSPGARLADGKTPPLSAVKHLLPFFPIMSQNQAAFESFILKAFLDFSVFFFLKWWNYQICQKSLGAVDGIAARWPILPRTRWTEANSGASQRQRRPRPLGTALCPFTRPPSSHPEDKGLLSPKQAFLSPTPKVQVLQPPVWKLKSHFSLPKRHGEPSSKLRRAKKMDFLN